MVRLLWGSRDHQADEVDDEKEHSGGCVEYRIGFSRRPLDSRIILDLFKVEFTEIQNLSVAHAGV